MLRTTQAPMPRPSSVGTHQFLAWSAGRAVAALRILRGKAHFAEVVGRTPFPGLAKARMELRARAWAQPSFFDELTKGGLGHQTALFKDWRVLACNPNLAGAAALECGAWSSEYGRLTQCSSLRE
jgi:hypothetical protein